MLRVPAAMTKGSSHTSHTFARRATRTPARPAHFPGRPRAAGPAGTHPTATRRQRRAGCTMRASQAAASRPSGDRGPGDTGAGPSRSELQRECSAEPGSSGSRRNTQPTASARKPAHAEPRHSAMRTHRRTEGDRILSRLAPPPGWARDDAHELASHPRATCSSSSGRSYW